MGMFQVPEKKPPFKPLTKVTRDEIIKANRPGNKTRKVKLEDHPYMGQKLAKAQQKALTGGKTQFVIWDGEGVVHDGRKDMSYVLLGYADGSERNDTYINSYQLSTIECLEYIYSTGIYFGTGYTHCSFGFNFDVDQILRDVPTENLQELKETNETTYSGYKLTYIPRKFFNVTVGNRRGITIFDTVSFFATTLIKACKQYLPGDERIDEVEKGKEGRSTFRYDELDSIILPYWRIENDLCLSLMSALRFSLSGAGIKLTSWHGPGAIANSLIIRERIATHLIRSRQEMPSQVTDATAYAYFGGRFEAPIIGRISGPIYSYDIRSAYPAALALCPGLEGGEWLHERNVQSIPQQLDDWGIYRVTLHGSAQQSQGARKRAIHQLSMGPLPNRAEQGTVSFAVMGSGWYYGHEVKAALMTGWDLYIHEGWRYENSTTQPFQFLYELYLQRADWKRAGNPAQLAAKLGLNSIYGKLAQLTGWDEEAKLPPKYHQQWYAGQATSRCRAMLWLAMSQCPEAIVACETDGIYSLERLSVSLSSRLGDWEEEIYDEVIYVQSGMYFMRKGICHYNCGHTDKEQEEGQCAWIKAKTRGMGKGNVGVVDAMRHLSDLSPIDNISVHRYGSLSGYLGREHHWEWFDEPREIVWGGDGKRKHTPSACPKCNGISPHGPHRTIQTKPQCDMSEPRNLPWVTGDKNAWIIDAQEGGPMVDFD